MGLVIPPLSIKILLESNPLKSRILVRRLAVCSLILVQLRAFSSAGRGSRVPPRGDLDDVQEAAFDDPRARAGHKPPFTNTDAVMIITNVYQYQVITIIT